MKAGTKLWVAGAFLLVAGCSAPAQQPVTTVTVTPPSSASAPVSAPSLSMEPDPKAVAWLDGLCGAVHGYRVANNEARKSGGSGVEVTKRWLSDELGRLAGLAGKTVDELNALPASPVPLGDTAKQSFVDKFAASRDIAAEGKKKLDAAKGSGGLDAGIKAMQDAEKTLDGAYDPLAPLKPETSREVGIAAASAKKCTSPS